MTKNIFFSDNIQLENILRNYISYNGLENLGAAMPSKIQKLINYANKSKEKGVTI